MFHSCIIPLKLFLNYAFYKCLYKKKKKTIDIKNCAFVELYVFLEHHRK